MSATHYVKLTETEIKRQADSPAVQQLRDHRYPALLLRFRPKNRARASWLLVWHAAGKSASKKLGNWPDLSASQAIELLPAALAKVTANPDALVAVEDWSTAGDLLLWYLDRAQRDRGLSDKRKAGIRSLVACQLLPRLSSLRLPAVTRDALDDRLIWPMQEVRSLAYTRSALALLKRAFKQAAKLKRLTFNPLADVVFTDFTDTKIRPKPCSIRPQQLPSILGRLADLWKGEPGAVVLALLMLCHGTRITETRLARWANFDLVEGGEWYVPPKDTKTKAEHTLPLTRQVVQLLNAYRAWQVSRGYSGAYLFPRGDGKPLSEKQAQERFVMIAAGEEWTSHDLRKIARSLWADLGVDYLIGELLLNHALDDLDATYIHTHAKTLKRDALERWHNYLDAQGLSFFATRTEPERPALAIAAQVSTDAALSPV